MSEQTFDREKIQSKIKKLLNLAGNNPNKEEAQSAFLKAQELLLQYKIEMHEIEGDAKEAKISEAVSHQMVNTPWARVLANILAKNFRCMYFIRKFGNNRRFAVFFGEEEDANIACGMYDYAVVWLNKSACNYATMMRNKYRIVKGVKQDYILGFLKGLEDKFEEQIRANAQYALVVVVPPKVKEEYKKLNIKTKVLSNTIYVHGSEEARAAGYQAGRSFQTNMIK